MSIAVLESPSAVPSQLVFSWSDASTIETPDRNAGAQTAVSPSAVAFANAHQSSTSRVPEWQAGQAFRDADGGPVRIGSFMIRLLKRYGISDQEIDEGLAEYAARTQARVVPMQG